MSEKITNMVGKKYGKWTVLKEDGHLYGRPAFLCVCECGKYQRVNGNELRRGKTKGCRKCAVKDRSIFENGDFVTKMPEYNIYNGMLDRCYNKKCHNYFRYGGRGIVVCERWKNSFKNFINDMGKRPSKDYSIDRIDNNGNYTPENCRWTTTKDQNNNRRPKESVYITYRTDKHIFQIQVKGKFVGYTKTKEDAIRKRDCYIKENNVYVRIKNDN